MKAVMIRRVGSAVVGDLIDPVAGGSEVLVRVEACGICHSDLHALNADWGEGPQLPRIPGHECIGVIEAVGSDVDPIRIGQRVAVGWIAFACGACDYCLTGRENLCCSQESTGYSRDGALAERVVVDARFAVPVPIGIVPAEAAPLACAGVTSFRALEEARAQTGETVAVFGVGGLGHLAIQYALLRGCRVIAIDVDDDKLQLARELGATETVNSRREDAAAAVNQQGGADVAMVFVPSVAVLAQGFEALRRGGRLVCIGLPPAATFELPVNVLVTEGKSVIGSVVGTRGDLATVLELHAAGLTRLVTEVIRLEDAIDGFDRLAAGRVRGRLVVGFSETNAR